MKKAIKLISLLMAVIMLAGIFTACGGKNEAGNSTEKVVTEKKQAADSRQKETKLVLYHWDATPVTKQIIEEFERDNAGIKVDWVMTPNKEYPDKLKVSLAGGEDIDVFAIASAQELAGIIDMDQAMVLDELILKNKFDVVPYGATIEQVKLNGKIYGLPSTKVAFILYYNKTLFKKLNVPEPKQDMTWNEYVELSKKLTRGEGADKIWGSFMHPWEHLWCMPALQKGKTVLDDNLTEFKKAMELRYQMQMIDKSEMSWAESVSTKAHHRDIFAKGNTGMIIAGPWMVGILENFKKEGKINFEYDIAPPPHPEGVPAGTTHGGVGTIVINPRTKNVDEAWKFISYYCGEKGAVITAKNRQLPAYTNDAIIQAYIGEGKPYPEHLDVLLKTNVYPQEPLISGVNKVIEIFRQEGELMLTGQKPIEKGFEDIAKRRKEVLKK